MVTDIEQITPLVERVLSIDDITSGDGQKGYLARYRGRLRMDPTEAYQALDESLEGFGLTPLFRVEDGRHAVLIQAGRAPQQPFKPMTALVLFLVTTFSVLFTGAASVYLSSSELPADAGMVDVVLGILRNLRLGVPFAASLMAILLAHEFGHYLVSRYYNAPVTLPYFVPFPWPISPFGTMGAVIVMKAPPRNRRTLLDIGLAGPLAGLIVSIPILIYGLSISTVSVLEQVPNGSIQMEGNSLLYLFLKWAVFKQVLPAPASYGGLAPVLYWVRYFFTGTPFPWGGLDVMISPVAFAGWAGLFVTALNLLPVGQLDGGHIMYALFGPKVKRLFPFIIGLTVLLGFAWPGWWLWTVLLFLFGRAYDQPSDQITLLDGKRKVMAVIGLVVFFLVFTPVPLILVGPGI